MPVDNADRINALTVLLASKFDDISDSVRDEWGLFEGEEEEEE